MAPGFEQSLPDRKSTREAAPPRRLLSLLVVTAGLLAATAALTVLGESLSTQKSILTAPENSFRAVAVVLAAWLLLAYPLWPGTILAGPEPLVKFWPWLGLRLAEVALILLVAAPVLVTATLFSHLPLVRVAETLAGLAGVGLTAIAYRLVHQTCRTGLRSLTLLDTMLLLFGPLVVGYLMLEFYNLSIGWCWLISPLVLASDVSAGGLDWSGANVLVGLVGYSGLAAVAIYLVLPFARWCREEDRKRSEGRKRLWT